MQGLEVQLDCFVHTGPDNGQSNRNLGESIPRYVLRLTMITGYIYISS